MSTDDRYWRDSSVGSRETLTRGGPMHDQDSPLPGRHDTGSHKHKTVVQSRRTQEFAIVQHVHICCAMCVHAHTGRDPATHCHLTNCAGTNLCFAHWCEAQNRVLHNAQLSGGPATATHAFPAISGLASWCVA